MTMKPRDAIHNMNTKMLQCYISLILFCWLHAAQVVCLLLLISVCLIGTKGGDDSSTDDKMQVLNVSF